MTSETARAEYRTDAAEQYASLADGFERALRARADLVVERWFRMAGVPTRFRVVGPDFAGKVLRPFAHLAVDAADDAFLTVDLWDQSETGIGAAACEVHSTLDWFGCFGSSANGRFVMHELAQTKSVLDRVERRLVGWAGTHEQLTLYELGRPLHSQLLLWHKDRGIQAVHAGLVARDGEGILFGGPGGSGKSTVALTCHRAGFDFLGDDYIGVERRDDGGWIGHSVYSSTHVDPGHLETFPALVPHAVHGTLPTEDKVVVLLSEARPERLVRHARIRAIVLPRVAHTDTTVIRPASSAEALLQLGPSSLLMLPHAGVDAAEFKRMSTLVETVPTYRADLGRDFERIPDRIQEVLESSIREDAS